TASPISIDNDSKSVISVKQALWNWIAFEAYEPSLTGETRQAVLTFPFAEVTYDCDRNSRLVRLGQAIRLRGAEQRPWRCLLAHVGAQGGRLRLASAGNHRAGQGGGGWRQAAGGCGY